MKSHPEICGQICVLVTLHRIPRTITLFPSGSREKHPAKLLLAKTLPLRLLQGFPSQEKKKDAPRLANSRPQHMRV